MTASYLSLTHLTPAFSANALVLVPNNRLRNHLLRAYALQQKSKAWLKPNIQSLNQWLEFQWEQLQSIGYTPSLKIIASAMQRQLLWEKAIKQSAAGELLLQPQPLALQSDATLRNLELWQLTATDLQNDIHFVDQKSNTAQFIQWLATFNADLSRQNSITKETSFIIIAEAFTQGALSQLPEIYLEGFDDLPPLMQMVLSSASAKLIKLPNQIASHTQLIRTQAETSEEEMRAAALWAKQQLISAPETALIGIVVPNLGQCRDRIERIFTEIFEPIAILPSTPRYTLPFNFSAGTPLGSTPLIYSLFEILNLQQQEWPTDRLCNLLYSPFWGDEAAEAVARTQLIHRLRELEQLTLTTADVRYAVKRLEEQIPSFAALAIGERFESLGNLLRRKLSNKSAKEWIQLFDEIITIMGWPGSRRLDSQEYQQLNLWFELRNEFISLDSHCAPFSYQQACRLLRQLADKTPFQAQTPDSPIQILGALEAAGLQFSHLWVMGLNDSQWPSVPTPNPLLPLGLQRKYKMPHASAERELEIAEGLTTRYRQAAPIVIFSNAHTDGDNELRASALIRDIPLTPLTELLSENTHTLQRYYDDLIAHSQLEIIHDAQGPALSENETVRGGSSLLKLQATCPFSAFAQLRLGARNPNEPTIGFSAIERGNLLHESLAAIWKTLNNSAVLNNTTETELKKLVDDITQSIIQHAQQRNPRKLGSVYCALEQERLSQLLCEWLNGERSRPAFTVIEIEQENTVEFMGLSLKLRIDRIDEFENGEHLLIDYKTGSASSKSWQSDRPSEPQLPLYAVTANATKNIAAISFAVINRKQQLWDGLGELHGQSQQQPNIALSENWELQMQEWQYVLQKLANDFIQGDARVDFVNPTAARHANELTPLNRYLEATAIENFIAQQMPNQK